MRNSTGKLSSLVKRGKQFKKGKIKLPIATLLLALLVIGGGIGYKAVALSGINVSSPNGGEIWGGTQEIVWTGDCKIGDTVNIFWGYGGTPNSPGQQTFIATTDCNSSPYLWDTTSMGHEDGNEFTIRIENSNMTSTYDYSNGFFTIDNTNPTITSGTLISPNGGEFWAGGAIKSITWDSSDITDNNLKANPITLEYYNGTKWEQIATGETNDGSYEWNLVPSLDISTAKIRITATDKADNTASDESDAVFTIDSINPAVVVTLPNGGEFLKGGSTYAITWTATDTNMDSSPITLEYYDGSSWVQITTGEANDGSYNWAVPNLDINTAKIGITAVDKAGNTGSGESDSAFTIDSTNPTSAATVTNDYYGPSTWVDDTTIKGTASDTLSGVNLVTITIKGSDDKYWNGTDWQTNSADLSVSGTETWTYIMDNANLTDGVIYTITPTATDKAGNSLIGASDNFTYDSSVPSTPTVSVPANAVITNADSYTIEGVAEAGSLVQIYEGTSVIATQQLPGTNYSITVDLTQNTVNSFTVTATDAVGNESGFTPVPSITEDSIDPASEVIIDNNYYGSCTWDDDSTINGTASDTNVALVTITIQEGSKYWNGSTWETSVTNLPVITSNNYTAWTYIMDNTNFTDGVKYTVTPTAIDNASNSAVGTSDGFTYDLNGPAVTNIIITPLYIDGTTNYISALSDISATVTDTGSGVASCEYILDGGTTWTSATYSATNNTCSVTGVDTDPASSINMQAIDSVSNVGTGTAVDVTVDITPPVTTDSGITTGWTKSDITVTLTPTDTDGSGVASTQYCIYNKGETACIPNTVGTSVSVTCVDASTCKKLVRYHSVDNVGNIEATKTSDLIQIDKESPAVTNIIITPLYIDGTTNYISALSDISATVTDTGSGVAGCKYTLDGGTDWYSAGYSGDTCSVTIDTSGATSINMRVTDTVSNVGAGTAVPVTVDITSPTFTIQYYSDESLLELTSLGNNPRLKAGTYYIKITASETLSGAPTISIGAEGSANDVINGVTVLVSENDYKYTRVITYDLAAIGSVLENISITGSDAVDNTATDVNPANESSKATFTDTILPIATVTVGTSIISDNDLIQEVTVTYNEEMSETSVPAITFSGGAWTSNSAGSWETNTKWTQSFTITNSEEEITGVTVTSLGAKDAAGNIEGANTTAPIFIIDTKNPIVVSVIPTSLNDTDVNTNSGTVSVVITFSEAMDSTNPTVTITGLTITPYTVASSSWSADKKEWKGTFTFNDNDEVGTGIYNISGAKDVVGNEMDSDSTNTVAVDTKNSTATVTVGTAIISDNNLVQEVTVTYDEEMLATPVPTIAFSGGTWTSNNNGAWDGTVKIWTELFIITDNEEEIDNVDVIVNGAKDVVGNTQESITTENLFDIDTKNPSAPVAGKMTVIMNAPGTDDTISGSDGAVEASALVKVYSDVNLQTLIDSAPANENGIFGPIDIGNNQYAIVYVTATDVAGNESLATEKTNDVVAPTITVALQDGDDYVNAIEASAGISILITTTDIEDDQTVTCNITDGTNSVGSLTGTISGNTATIASGDLTDLNDGTITATCDVSDLAGNPASQGSDTSNKDVESPTVAITSPLTGTKVNGNNAVITFTGSESATPQCSVDNSAWTVCTSGTTKLSDIAGFSNLSEDAFTLYLEDTDNAGNTGTDSETGIIKDTVLPIITDITSDIVDGSYTIGKEIDIDITFSENIISDGDITVTLDTGGTCVIPQITTAVSIATCEYYTVATGENTDDLDATVLGVIIDEAGNLMADFTPNKSLATNKDILIDTAAPVFDTYADITAEATSASGTVVNYTNPTATDNLDGTISISCSPISGSTFPLGETTVICSATDTAGNEATSSFTVTVEDTTVPVIEVHADVTAEATSPAGADVTYTAPNSTDAVDGVQSAVCLPVSGSTFVLGDTTVTCDITDSYGNVATQTLFIVTVKDATSPEITNLTPASGSVTSDTTPTISAEFTENGSGVDIGSVIITVDGINVTAFSTIDANSVSHTPNSSMADGYHTVAVDASDIVGNSAVQASWVFEVASTETTVNVTTDKSILTADGISQAKITALVYDNDASANGSVTFSTTIGTITSVPVVLDENGKAFAYLTSNETGQTTVTAYFNSGNGVVSGTTVVTFIETEKTISVAANPMYSVPADGSTPSTIIATVLDGGVALKDATVNFVTDLGALSSPIVITDSNGEASVTLTSTGAGWANIEATYTGSGTINNWTNVEFTEYNDDVTPPTVLDWTPTNGSKNVDVNTNIVLNFDEKLAASTDTVEDKFKLRPYSCTSDTCNISVSVAYDNNTQVVITPNQPLDYGQQYFIYIVSTLQDLVGNNFGSSWQNGDQDSHEFTTAVDNSICHDNGDGTQTCNISLNAGWNLISLPLIPDDSAIATVLAGISDNLGEVRYYESGGWQYYIPENIEYNLTTMEDGKGYWIFMEGNENDTYTLTLIGTEMPAGGEMPASYSVVGNEWNLIGFKSVENMPVESYINQMGSGDVLWVYKNGEYDIVNPSGSGIMEPGYGYWLYPYGNGYEIIPTN